MDKYLNGDELYRYLHISKRKMKYLLENGYIPMIDTGKKTHGYKVRLEDAEAFRVRRESEPEFLSELKGKFNIVREKKVLTEEEREVLKEKLTREWKDLPDALPRECVAKLLGCSSHTVYKMIADGKLIGVKVGMKTYCLKENVVEVTVNKRWKKLMYLLY